MFHLKNSLVIPPFLFVFILLWTAGRLRCKWHLGNGLKTLTLQKVVCSLIHNPLADTSALVWLLVFKDFGSYSPVNDVSNGSITTFLQTSPSISAVRFLSSLCLVIASPPFGQDKVCCKLNESPQTHSDGKRSRGILYVIRIASQKACLSRKKPFLFIDITVNQIDAPFSALIFLYHFHNNLLLFLVSRLCFSDNKSNHSFLYIIKKIKKHFFSLSQIRIVHYANCIIFAHISKANSVSTSFHINNSNIIKTHSFLH